MNILKKSKPLLAIGIISSLIFIAAIALLIADIQDHKGQIHVNHPLIFAPNILDPIIRKNHAFVHVDLHASVVTLPINGTHKYQYWTFGGHIPGPFIRARQGDTLVVSLTNDDASGMQHNIDFHAVTGPGGGAPLLTASNGQTKRAQFKLLHPGLFIYHCAVAPIPMHISNGMFGLLLVEPKRGLPKVDREYYVVQHEIYADEPKPDVDILNFSYKNGLIEHPRFVVFNDHVGSLIGDNMLHAKTGERIRIFFGNAGPNLISSFHIIGAIFDKVYREGDLISPPARSVQTTLVPVGGATVVEFEPTVPGNYALVDHAIFRIDKGAVGFIQVSGIDRPDIYYSKEAPVTCEKCKVHP